MNKLLYTDMYYKTDGKVIVLTLRNDGMITDCRVDDLEGNFIGNPDKKLVVKLVDKIKSKIFKHMTRDNNWKYAPNNFEDFLSIQTGLIYNPNWGVIDMNIKINQTYVI